MWVGVVEVLGEGLNVHGGSGGCQGGSAQRGCDRLSGKRDLNYKRKMQIGLKSE